MKVVKCVSSASAERKIDLLSAIALTTTDLVKSGTTILAQSNKYSSSSSSESD